MNRRRHLHGFTLIEMMVSVTIALLLSIAVIFLYVGQTQVFAQAARKDQMSQEVVQGYEVLSRLLRQAQICLDATLCGGSIVTVTPSYGSGARNSVSSLELSNDNLQLDFTIPAGYSIWPNSTAPYNNNSIRISWSNSGANAYQIVVRSGASFAALGDPIVLIGANDAYNTRIINLDVWPLQANGTAAGAATDRPDGGYQLTMTGRVGPADPGYVNSLDATGPLKNYRTVSFVSTVFPRNW